MDKSALLILFAAAAVCCAYAEEFHYIGHEFDKTALGEAVDKASMKLLKEAYTAKAAEGQNVVSSPLGVLLLLSLYSHGAEGPVRDEIVRALGSDNYDQLLASYSGLSERFASMDASYLTLANKVYVAKQFELADSFADAAVKFYRSEAESIDFGQPKEAAAIINKWSDEKTKGHIKNPIDDDALSPEVVAALVNVIFFQGHWDVPFNASETVDKDFHVDKSSTVQKPTMRLEQSLFYHESKDLGARLVELPYKEQNFRMVVVLPDEIDGLPSVLEKVAERGLLTDVFDLEPAGRDVLLELPKFEIKSGLDLNNFLPKVGVSKIFSEPAGGILKGQPVKVSKAFQEAFVKVDEEGATAGAFTGVVIVPTSSISEPPPAMEFKVDHPFLFVILHEDIVLFAGAYSH